MWRKFSGMARRTVVHTVEHYQCGAVRVRYVNSWEWSDVWSDVQVTTAICGARSGLPQYKFALQLVLGKEGL